MPWGADETYPEQLLQELQDLGVRVEKLELERL